MKSHSRTWVSSSICGLQIVYNFEVRIEVLMLENVFEAKKLAARVTAIAAMVDYFWVRAK